MECVNARLAALIFYVPAFYGLVDFEFENGFVQAALLICVSPSARLVLMLRHCFLGLTLQ